MRTLGRRPPHGVRASADTGGAEAAAGRSHPLTILTPIPAIWGLWLWLNFHRIALVSRWRERRGKPGTHAQQVLMDLAFVSFGHWAVVRTGGGLRALLRPRYLLFQSNFNGDARQYFEAFSRQLTREMEALWLGAWGPPSPVPVKPFQDYILEHRVPPSHHHYYCAYPDGSVKMVLRAQELEAEIHDLTSRAGSMEPDEFKRAYHDFLVRTQTLL